jgi:hypothetical protein
MELAPVHILPIKTAKLFSLAAKRASRNIPCDAGCRGVFRAKLTLVSEAVLAGFLV